MPPSADHVIETFECAIEENNLDPFRKEQVVNLPGEGELWMTGDLHDHRRNFEKLVHASDLGHHRDRHLVLHELLHGDHYDDKGREESWITLYRAAELKCDFPAQVHFMLANHDLAQIHGEGIMKFGVSVCEAFNAGVKRDFGDRSSAVLVAVTEFLLSLPLAVRTERGIFCCHTLPTDAQIDAFDYTIFDRKLTGPDYAKRVGPVYQLIWGRHFSPATVDKFLEKMGAKLVITGHQPQDFGYATNGDKHLIIASDHNQGVYLPIDLGADYDMPALVQRLQRLVAIDLNPQPDEPAPLEEISDADAIDAPPVATAKEPASKPAAEPTDAAENSGAQPL